jgi:capsule biosynthesis phosphatase
MQTFVIDVDGTICDGPKREDGTYDYQNAVPIERVIQRINRLYDSGNTIVLFTARGMRSYNGDLEKIKKNVVPILQTWLKTYNVKYHRLEIGKPWGENPIYIDNRNLSIRSFVQEDPEQFEAILNMENSL